MAQHKKKSTKQSVAKRSAPSPPDAGPVFFLDRDLGRYDVAAVMRKQGLRVEVHDDHFDMALDDATMLAEVGKRKWVLLTKDRHILTRVPEIIALVGARVHAFILKQGRNQELTGQQVGAAFA